MCPQTRSMTPLRSAQLYADLSPCETLRAYQTPMAIWRTFSRSNDLSTRLSGWAAVSRSLDLQLLIEACPSNHLIQVDLQKKKAIWTPSRRHANDQYPDNGLRWLDRRSKAAADVVLHTGGRCDRFFRDSVYSQVLSRHKKAPKMGAYELGAGPTGNRALALPGSSSSG